MKVLRIVVIVLLALLAIVLIKTYSSDPDFDVNRSITIDAPARAIWPHVSSLEKADEWNPWMEIDPDTKKEYGGEQGTIGSWASWESDNSDVGSGKQTVNALEENKLVETELRFGGWDGTSTGYTRLDERDGKTEVTYGFKGTNESFMARAFMSFMDMETTMAPMFDKGLSNLKLMVESNDAAIADEKLYRGYSVAEMNRDSFVYVGKRDRVAMKDLEAFFSGAFPAALKGVNEAGINMAGMPTAVYYEWNEDEGMVELMAGMPVVGDENTAVEGLETVVIPAGKALNISYTGGYSNLKEPHMALEEKMNEEGMEFRDVAIEEYVTDPGTEPDSNKWVTEIYYMIK